jgi:hypothetical protein
VATVTDASGTATPTHDANGNLTAFKNDSYGWDVRGRLRTVERRDAQGNIILSVVESYDPWNRRMAKGVNGAWTNYVYDDDDVVGEVFGNSVTWTLHGPILDEPLARNGLFFTPNHLGSTTTLTDGVGAVVQSYTYSPFGETTPANGTVANPFQFTGRKNGLALHWSRSGSQALHEPVWAVGEAGAKQRGRHRGLHGRPAVDLADEQRAPLAGRDLVRETARDRGGDLGGVALGHLFREGQQLALAA